MGALRGAVCEAAAQPGGAAMTIHLFGAATPTGDALRALARASQPECLVQPYSRTGSSMARADLADPLGFEPAASQDRDVWVSFAPIWLLAPFLEVLRQQRPEQLQRLRGLVACSSSSALTKRFATNHFDRQLVVRLQEAELQLQQSCRALQIPLTILRPTLIYGSSGHWGDRNLSRLVALMRRLPLLPLPASSGLRQPIHASQLAAVALQQATAMVRRELPSGSRVHVLGGDEQLSYAAMVRQLQQALPARDRARRCRVLELPDRLFFLAASPLLLLSPKGFEAVLRIGADLAGFSSCSELMQGPRQSFPVLPLALP